MGKIFLDKELEIGFEILLENIRINRNKVAHAKTFLSDDYNVLNADLNKGIKLVKNTLKITETKDFQKKKRRVFKWNWK